MGVPFSSDGIQEDSLILSGHAGDHWVSFVREISFFDRKEALMIHTLSQSWWVLVLRGVLAISFALLAIAFPWAALVTLALVFGAYAFIDGIAALWLGVSGHTGEGRVWPSFFFGIFGILAGVVAFLWPGITLFALLTVVAAWAIVRGISEIVLAVRLRRIIEGEWIFGFSGVLSIVFGVLLFTMPGAGLVALVWLTAFYAFLSGIVSIALGLRLHYPADESDFYERTVARPV